MSKIDVKVDVTNLFEIYKELLTNKQREVFEMYYYEDESINEIAAILDVSKNAVFNNLEKTKKNLFSYESKLHIYYNFEFNKNLLEAYEISEEIVSQLK